jgi:histone H3/H4
MLSMGYLIDPSYIPKPFKTEKMDRPNRPQPSNSLKLNGFPVRRIVRYSSATVRRAKAAGAE